jgi:hypothetical protein
MNFTPEVNLENGGNLAQEQMGVTDFPALSRFVRTTKAKGRRENAVPFSNSNFFGVGYFVLARRKNRKPRVGFMSSEYLVKSIQAIPNLPGSEWSDQSHEAAKDSFSLLTSGEFATRNDFAVSTRQSWISQKRNR